jgi:alpha-L-fucosidase
MAQYDATSPYFTTGYTQFYLDVMVNRPIPKQPDDLQFTINQTYQYRPDLLSFDLYDTPTLWWVFYQRNPNALQTPPVDFTAGTVIYLPKISTLRTVLGF